MPPVRSADPLAHRQERENGNTISLHSLPLGTSHWPTIPDSPTGRKSKKPLNEGSGCVPKSHRLPEQSRKARASVTSKDTERSSLEAFCLSEDQGKLLGMRLWLPLRQHGAKQIHVVCFFAGREEEWPWRRSRGRSRREMAWSIRTGAASVRSSPALPGSGSALSWFPSQEPSPHIHPVMSVTPLPAELAEAATLPYCLCSCSLHTLHTDSPSCLCGSTSPPVVSCMPVTFPSKKYPTSKIFFLLALKLNLNIF